MSMIKAFKNITVENVLGDDKNCTTSVTIICQCCQNDVKFVSTVPSETMYTLLNDFIKCLVMIYIGMA